MTQTEIYSSIQSIIPADLWAKYSHLTFAEMAEQEELSDYAKELIKAENDWYDAE